MAKQKQKSRKFKTGSGGLRSGGAKKWLQWKVIIPLVVGVALVGGFLVYRSNASINWDQVDWNCPFTCTVTSQTPYSASYWTVTGDWLSFNNSTFDAYAGRYYRICFGARNYNSSDSYVLIGPDFIDNGLYHIVPAHTTNWTTYCSLPYQPQKGTVKIAPKLRVGRGPRLQVNWLFVQTPGNL